LKEKNLIILSEKQLQQHRSAAVNSPACTLNTSAGTSFQLKAFVKERSKEVNIALYPPKFDNPRGLPALSHFSLSWSMLAIFFLVKREMLSLPLQLSPQKKK